MENKSQLVVRYVLFILLIAGLTFLSVSLIRKGFNDKKIYIINYQPETEIDYKVYLKKNNFFDNKYLTKSDLTQNNRSIITSLIDYIDVNFKYTVHYTDKVTGQYRYYIKTIIEANKVNVEGGNYWSKEYRLTETKSVDLKDKNNFTINENIKIDYDKYNSILNEFKKQYGLVTNGILKVVLVAQSNVTNDNITKNISLDNNETLIIPLSQLAVEATISLDEGSKTSSNISEIVKLKDTKYIIYKVCGVICGIGAIACIVLMIQLIQNQKSLNAYNLTLKKILNNYDNVIVNVDVMPDVSKLNVIHVNSFEELIDAHGEVRMPINYYQSKKENKSAFILINDKIAWIYILRDKREKHKKSDLS